MAEMEYSSVSPMTDFDLNISGISVDKIGTESKVEGACDQLEQSITQINSEREIMPTIKTSMLDEWEGDTAVKFNEIFTKLVEELQEITTVMQAFKNEAISINDDYKKYDTTE